MPVSGVKVYNHDVKGLCERLNRFREEVYKSVSSGLAGMNQFDVARLTSYINAIRTYQAWVLAQPQLDLPETHPREYLVEPAIAMNDSVESEDANMILTLLGLASDELANCQSARMPSGLISFDSDRLKAVVDKTEAFLVSYVQVATPLDLPESSPQEPMTGPGKLGV
jgi:hypothetical protein